MVVILIGIIIILAGITAYLAYRYAAIRSVNKELVNGMKELATGHMPNKVEEKSAEHAVYNQLIDHFSRVRENFLSFSTNVHQIGGSLSENGENAAEKADIVRAAIDEVGRGLEKQLVAIEESTVSMEDMAHAIDDLSQRSNQISEQSTSTLDLTKEGNEKLQNSLAKMEQFGQTIEVTLEAMNKLGEKSNEIGSIVKVITGITEQINLLALNAAIEAARAGEHGKGFAVVADEVRNLAEQSRLSSAEVADIVKNIQEETEVLVKSMRQGTEEFGEANETIIGASSMFGQILSTTEVIAENNLNSSASTEELSSSSQQIMSTLNQIAFISRESVEMFEELVEISDDELMTMQKLVDEAQSLVTIKEDVERMLSKYA
ncbi:methyl-accepting chemotaxis protein [Metasolibacillus sp.]|uniref:methyl-accepting chemotaxis protein n=1 Tax=Metasolibacillus sp. TaxID=2703680 RepID=UPI0025DCCC3B|nr:methyl-accepting chemotaxis protein [Metasolibacillus sp.]MCT6923008.1 methyl-accepting chemotaxis protein [Metasolibacillus sp.]MCT6939246.1 methyl-accepting chemotaxis protein [Metasolibacillus sp.]